VSPEIQGWPGICITPDTLERSVWPAPDGIGYSRYEAIGKEVMNEN